MSQDTAIEAGAEEDRKTVKRRLRAPLMIAAPVLVLLGALFFYLHGGRYEATDNAYVQAGMVEIAPSVGGHVVKVLVSENESVRAGQVLFMIEPGPYRSRVAASNAALDNARTGIAARRADFEAAKGREAAARAQLDYAQREAARQKRLLADGISSQDDYDKAVLAVRTAHETIRSASQESSSIAAELSGSVNSAADSQPAVRQAAAVLNDAQRDLGYTTVRAPQDGIVTKVSQLQVGDYVTAGKPVFTLVGKHLWIEANFKEDQLRYMRLGQPVTVEVAAFPGEDLKGHVASFSPGTGNAFALLPAENATGNWVKVVQRLPVEIELDRAPSALLLHAGLSAEVTVDTGHQRHLFGPDTPPVQPKVPPRLAR
ncbi:MAG: HlyD family secretion protein [Candidatus Andeanibacterium colombiense]|uniref:HlyD family secretion protein n=1 Tax=Candidatus Andeanibacterium colombiense TaxID=3121345 RepID=A0AAJ6BNW5_9SPHN|nr:MAG: HlyD family secretion protein [Sphingomonadaceae bacterium]